MMKMQKGREMRKGGTLVATYASDLFERATGTKVKVALLGILRF
jgi:hypothetical protein